MNQASHDPSPLIKDTNLQSFAVDVIEASQTRPVIVDFWADWCQPCKQLMPALEAAVTAAGGAVAMVRVNADENQALCGQMHVQSLPTVFAFYQGQPVDGFQGAVPPSQITAFVDKLKALSDGAGDNQIDAALDHADELLDDGQTAEAMALYHQVYQAEQGNARALIGLADVSVGMKEMEQAEQVLSALDESTLTDDAKGRKLKDRLSRIKARLDMLKAAGDAGDVAEIRARIDADPADFEARFDLAIALQASEDLSGAAEALLYILMRDMDWGERKAHSQLLKLFDVAGPSDPFTLKYRRRLSSLLFS